MIPRLVSKIELERQVPQEMVELQKTRSQNVVVSFYTLQCDLLFDVTFKVEITEPRV